jgi:2,3-bisphosphoglycerate-independent phosphoglycerate mutase
MSEGNGIRKTVLVIMDGVGLAPESKAHGDAVRAAKTPVLDRLFETCPHTHIKAHGVAVGLPGDGDMGNSEVGHNALGSGQIYAQGAKLVNESIASGRIFTSDTWKALVDQVKTHNGTLHFLGLLSDGNVHSNISHLKALITEAKKEGVSKVRVHALLDGRDVPPTSGMEYIEDMENFFSGLRDADFDVCFASGGGRMCITMDRYKADWGMVHRGWQTHVLGEGRQFASAAEAYNELREETGKMDQDLPGFVIAQDGKPVGTIEDGDSVVFFNFRGDRAIEISMAFEDEEFPYFDRIRKPDVFYAGMLEYDGDLHIPSHFLVNPPEIKHTLTEYLVDQKVNEFAVSETQKYGHVTYFWNGNRSGYVDERYERYVEIPSDIVPFEERPWMKSAEIADEVILAMESSDDYGFIRCNFANGDMVGHTGVFNAARMAVEAVDLALGRIIEAAAKNGYAVLVTADHGNADDMYQKKKSEDQPDVPKTSHSLNPVPFIVVDPDHNWTIKEGEFGLANVAKTICKVMGLEGNSIWEESIIE